MTDLVVKLSCMACDLPHITWRLCLSWLCDFDSHVWRRRAHGHIWESISAKIESFQRELSKWSRATFKRADKEISRLKDTLNKFQQETLTSEVQQ
ncbi:hypothetical protein PIB30_045647 [Stylosanthes scabra]|uniref:Uncharacterized protein n=1 Tax=Stylosanthes scabra TaxID=79078 RepID=A0ABU6WIZ4_9FABA|nr:hypothetical protein [Stylosanthes scabra]